METDQYSSLLPGPSSGPARPSERGAADISSTVRNAQQSLASALGKNVEAAARLGIPRDSAHQIVDRAFESGGVPELTGTGGTGR